MFSTFPVRGLMPLSFYVVENKGIEADIRSLMEYPIFQEAFFSLLNFIPVDDEWYRKNNPDVRAAEKDGLISSVKDHWVRFGYWENRQPHKITVDPDFYSETYGDIRRLGSGDLSAVAQDHFEIYGYKEGRLPFASWSLTLPAS